MFGHVNGKAEQSAGPAPAQPQAPWRWSFLSPLHWPTWLMLALLWLASRLTCTTRARIGRWLGALLWLLMRERRHIASVNLSLCFPGLDTFAREHLLRAHFRALGQGFVDMGAAWWGDGAALMRATQVSGMQRLQQELAAGRGVIVVAGHFTTMEMGARLLSQHSDQPYIYSIYRRSKNPVFEYVMLRGRIRQRAVMFPREDVRTMIGALRAGRPVCFFPDQDHGRIHSVFVPFCGVPAATVTSTARFARMGRASVMPMFQYRRADGGYELHLLAPLADFPSGDDTADALRISRLIEQQVLAHPAEYLWVHRRFKTRPTPGDDVYADGGTPV